MPVVSANSGAASRGLHSAGSRIEQADTASARSEFSDSARAKSEFSNTARTESESADSAGAIGGECGPGDSGASEIGGERYSANSQGLFHSNHADFGTSRAYSRTGSGAD